MQLLCAWSGIGLAVLFGAGGWLVAGFVPPASPASDAASVAAFYAANVTPIRIGLTMALIATALIAPWTAVISLQMNRMQGVSPVLSLIQVIAGGVTLPLAVLPVMFWLAAAFRPDRNPDLVLMLNDLGWLTILMTFAPPLVQLAAIGFATLTDRSSPPVFPRWSGYYNLWTGFLLVPGVLIVYFKTGPFAWSGVIGFWIPFGAFWLWLFVMTPLLLKAIRRA